LATAEARDARTVAELILDVSRTSSVAGVRPKVVRM
jgi:hypothetical protein